jgi:hypothetical protein
MPIRGVLHGSFAVAVLVFIRQWAPMIYLFIICFLLTYKATCSFGLLCYNTVPSMSSRSCKQFLSSLFQGTRINYVFL